MERENEPRERDERERKKSLELEGYVVDAAPKTNHYDKRINQRGRTDGFVKREMKRRRMKGDDDKNDEDS